MTKAYSLEARLYQSLIPSGGAIFPLQPLGLPVSPKGGKEGKKKKLKSARKLV